MKDMKDNGQQEPQLDWQTRVTNWVLVAAFSIVAGIVLGLWVVESLR